MEARLSEAEAQVKAAAAGVEKARADAQLAGQEAARLEAIQEEQENAVTAPDVDAAVAGRAAARAAVLLAEANLAVVRARRKHLEVMASYAVLRAPFSGRVTRRYLDTGALVREGTSSSAGPVFQVARDDRLRLVVQVPESAVPQVRKGTALEVRLDALAGDLLHGTVARLAGALDPATRSMRVEMDLENDDGRLRPGMYARVKIALPDRGGLGVPSRALHA
ncbi:MAG: efflux RND transporter periplasmic adaptor subunit, partial [Acidobacteriota bacterium]